MKKNLIILIIAIIILVVIMLLTKKPTNVPIETSNPAEEITPFSIENELNGINVDSGVDEDIKTIDQDLNNL